MISFWPEGNENRGFWLGKDYHRQGLMTEAVYAVNDFAFFVVGMTELKLGNAEPNIGSHRLKESSGAKITEIREDGAYVGGKFRSVRWLLTREDWEAHREAFLARP